MTKEELITLLRNPEQTGKAIDELSRLIEEYPYFHTGHQLYLKGLRQTDEMKMMFQLKKTAFCVRDRDVLYRYINRPSSNADTLNVQTASSINLTDQKPLYKDEEQQKTDDHLITDEKIINNDQLMNAIGRRPELIETTARPEEEQQQPSSETATNDKMAETVVDNTPVEIREKYTEKQLVSDLLKISPKRSDVPPTPAQNHPEEKKSGDNDGAPAVENRRWSSAELIDFFLKTNPKITPKDSQYEADLSESMKESQEIASETLADIYATQGHIGKAIDIYEQLILKYPQKHIYFAAQIKRLKGNK